MKRYKERINLIILSFKEWINEYYTLILVICSGLFIRLYHITYPIYDCMSFRQTQTASTILNFYRDGINILLPKVNSIGNPGVLVLEFPLFQAFSALIYTLLSPDIAYIRLLSIVCCLITAIYLYKLVVLFFDKESAIFSIIFFLFAPLSIFFSRTPMIESFAAMLGIMFLYYFILWIDQRKLYLLIIGVILASFALIVKPPYSIIMFPVIVYYAFYKYGLKTLKDTRFLVSLFLPLVILVIWQTYANYTNNLYNTIADYPYGILHKAFEVKISELNTWYFGTLSQRLDPATYIVIGKRIFYEVLTIIGSILVLVSLPLKNKKYGFFFEVWLATTVLSFVVILNLNYVHNYYQLPCISILAIYCGRGLSIIWQKIKNISILKDHKSKILTIILLLYLFNVGYVLARENYYQQDSPGYYNLGQQIHNGLPGDNNMVAISTLSTDVWNPTILYFADKKGYLIPQSLLSEQKINYCVNKGVVWLIITNYDQYLHNYDTAFLEKYPVLSDSTQELMIFRIDGQELGQ
jgi:hypothetical protein